MEKREYMTKEVAEDMIRMFDEPTDTPSPVRQKEVPKKEVQPEKGQLKLVKPKRKYIDRSEKGEWREVNPDLMLVLMSGIVNSSERQIIDYAIWSITSNKERNYINVKRKTIQDRTKLSKGQVSKTVRRLIDRKIFIQPNPEDNHILIFNPDYDTWQ